MSESNWLMEKPKAASSFDEQYERDGFAILRNVIDADLVREASQHLEWLMKKYPDLRPEHLHHPLMENDAFWVRLVTDERLLDIAEHILGPDLACFTAHYVCKPAHTGQPVFWHQDGAYWRLAPMRAITIWLAVDETTPENGCLKMIPGSHVAPLRAPERRTDPPNMLYSSCEDSFVREWTERASVVDVCLKPGDVSIHHAQILHCSEPNRSEKRRCGLDIGFISTSTRISNDGLYLNPILVRGVAVPGVNDYRPWPRYVPGETIPFRGHEGWNAHIAGRNGTHRWPEAHGVETPIEVTHRMIERLHAGTVKDA